MHKALAQPLPQSSTRFAQERMSRMYAELSFALSRIDRNGLRSWGMRSASRLFTLTARRVGGLAKLATVLARAGGSGVLATVEAYRQNHLSFYIADRTATAIDGTIALGHATAKQIVDISSGMIRDPIANAPIVLSTVLGFSAGSGGLDGNGGIPDLDLMAGIGAHRSVFTHTIIAGVVVEGLILAMADLSSEIHGKLPNDHDPLWDDLARIGRPLSAGLAVGTSAGLAYHFIVDALIQPAALHGLPVHMPMEGHQTVLAASSLAEGANAAGHADRREAVEIVQGGPPEMSTGRRVVNAVGDAAKVATTAAGNGLRSAGDAFRSWKQRR
jgi:hypothetical protein